MIADNKITIIAGSYGTGKTNIAVNMALSAAKPVYLVDYDIVNPYFRSADNKNELIQNGVIPLLPPYANTNVEISTPPDEYFKIFTTPIKSIIDVGGDSDGATALTADKKRYESCGYTMYFVFNAYRPHLKETARAYYELTEIQHSSGLVFSGIINNTNLGADTTKDDIYYGIKAADALSQKSKLPIIFTTAMFDTGIDNVIKITNKTKRLF